MIIKPDPRWSERKKRRVMLLIILLVFCLGLSVFSNVKSLYIKHVDNGIEEKIFDELLLINPQLDPAVAGVIARTIIKACKFYKIDPFLIVAIIKYESGCKIRAKNYDSGALGLMQWMVSAEELERLGMTEPEAIHIQSNIWKCVEILKRGFEGDPEKDKKRPGSKEALFYYNGVIANIDGGNEYTANVLSSYFDMIHRQVSEMAPGHPPEREEATE